MASDDKLYFELGVRDKLTEQVKGALKETEALGEALAKINAKTTEDGIIKMGKNMTANVNDAEKALYKYMDALEKADKALARNREYEKKNPMFAMDTDQLETGIKGLQEVCNKLMAIGKEAGASRTAVKDLIREASGDILYKMTKDQTGIVNKGLDKQEKQDAKNAKEVAKALAQAEKEAAQAAERNASAQEQVKNALSRIATARANLSKASEKGNEQEVAHARLLMSLLDRLAQKLNGMRGQFLGEKGALAGVLGSGYQGLMRNVSQAVRDIGKVESQIVQKPVAFENGNVQTTSQRITELIGRMRELGTGINHTMEAMGQGNMNMRAGQSIIANMRNEYEGLRRELQVLWQTYRQIQTSGDTLTQALGIGHLRGYTGPQTAMSDEAWKNALREAEVREVAAQAAEKHRQKLEELSVAFKKLSSFEKQEAAAQARATQRQENIQQRRANIQANREEASSLMKLRLQLLQTQAVELRGILKKGDGILNVSQIEEARRALRELTNEMITLRGAMASPKGYSAWQMFEFGRGSRDYSSTIQKANESLQKYAFSQVNVLSDSERKAIQSITDTNNALSRQGSIIGDLRTMATQYLSLWGARSMLNNIIETGGLLEQQRLSIGAILGSMDKANNIFAKIKDLAVKSPFGVVELDKMSKQLTAYGFEYEELFDWTKRLADISAATGTEVSRLALALGHVRSEGALSGYTLRQFAMGNVPMLQKLAENLGITTKQVRERTKKKEIGYDDVKEVLRQLTDEGGMFNNAQETMSEALNAKFKNLRDAFDIMYGEIAESGIGDILKGIAEALTAGAKEWQRFGTDVLVVAGALGVAKTAAMAYRAGMITLSREMGVLALNTRAYTAEQVQQLASEGAITREQLLRAVSTGRLSAEQARLAATTLGVSEATMVQAASSGKVTQAMIGNAMATSRFTVAQLRMISTLRAQDALFPVLRVGLAGLAAGFRTVGAAMKSFLPFLAIGAVVDFFSRYSQQVSAAKDLASEGASTLATGLENIKQTYDALNKKPPQGTEEMTIAISNMKEALKDEGAYSSIQKQVEGTRDLQTQYDILYEKSQKLAEGYDDMKYRAEAYLEAANKVGGGLFSENMKKDIEQYGDYTIKKDVAKGRADKYASVFKKELEAQLKKEGKWVEETMRGMDWTEQFSELGNLSFYNNIRRSPFSKDADLYNAAADAMMAYSTALLNVRIMQREVDAQMPEFAEYVKLALASIAKSRGLDFSDLIHWSDDDLRVNVVEAIDKLLSTFNVSEEDRKYIREEIIKTFPQEVQVRIKALPKQAKKDLEGWQKDMQAYFKKNKINIRLTADDSIQEVEKKLQAARKRAQEKMNSAGAILTFWKIKPDASAINEFKKKHPLLASLVDRVFGDFKEAKEEVDKIDKAHKDTGLTVIEPKKNKGSKGSKTDTQLKAWREQLKELENFYNVYKRYAEYMSKDDAIQKALDSDVFKGKNLPKNIDDYLSVLQDFRRKVEAEMGKNPGTERKSFLTDLLTKIDQKEFDVKTKEAAEKLLKQLDRELTAQGKKWDLYKRVLDATGDKGQAATMAFGGIIGFGDFAEQLRKQVEDKLKELKSPFTVEELLGMDEDELTLHFKEKGADGVYKMVQKLRDETQQLQSQQVEMYLDAVKSAKGYEAELRKIEAQYRKSADAILAMNPADTDALKAAMETRNESRAKVELEELKKSLNWEETFRDLDKQSTAYLQRLKEKLRAALKDKDLKPEQAKTLIEQIDKVDEQLGKRNFLTALLPGLRERRRITEETVEAEERLAKAIANEAAANLKVVGDKMRIQELLGQGGVNADISQITPESREELMKDIHPGGELYKALLELFKKLAEDSAEASTASGQTGAAQRDVSRQWEKLKNVKGIGSFFTEGFGGSDPISIIKGVNQNVQSLSELVDTIGLGDTEFGESVHEFADGCQSFSGVVDSLASGDVFGAVNGIVKGFQSWGRAFHLDDAFNNSNAEEVMRTTERLTKSNEVLAKRIDSLSERIGSSAGVDSINAYKQAVKAQREVNGNTLKVLKAQMSYHHAHQSNAHYASNETIAGYNRTAQNAFRTAGLEGFEITGLQSVYDAIAKDPRYLKAIRDFAPQLWEYLTEVGKYDKSEYWDAVVEDAEALEELTKQITENMTGWTADTLVDSWAQLVAGMNSGVNDLTQNLEEKLREAIVNSMIDNLFKDRLQSLLSQAWDNSQYIDRNGNVRTHHYDSDGNITDTDVASEYTPSEIADIRKEAKSAAEDILGVFGVLKDALGFTESGSTSSKVISGGFTEQETGLLLSYVNGIRADLSLQRADVNSVRTAIDQYFPEFLSAMGRNVLTDVQERNLQSIADNTRVTAENTAAIYGLLKAARNTRDMGLYMK